MKRLLFFLFALSSWSAHATTYFTVQNDLSRVCAELPISTGSTYSNFGFLVGNTYCGYLVLRISNFSGGSIPVFARSNRTGREFLWFYLTVAASSSCPSGKLPDLETGECVAKPDDSSGGSDGTGDGGVLPTDGECPVGYHMDGLLCYPNPENPNDPDPDDGGSSGGGSGDTGGGSSGGSTDTPDPDDSGDTTDPTTPTNPNNPPDNSGMINAINSLKSSNQSNFNSINQNLSALNSLSTKMNQSIVAQMNQDKDIAQAQLNATQKQIDASDAKTDEQTGALTEAIGETGDEIGDGLASIQDKLCDPRTDPRACEGENGLTADGVLGMYEQMIEGGDKAVSAGDAAYTEALEGIVSSDKTAESQDNIQGVANLLSLPTGSRCSLETLKTPVGSFQLGCEFATFLKTLLEFVFYIGTIYYILDILFDGVTPMPGNTSSSRGGR